MPFGQKTNPKAKAAMYVCEHCGEEVKPSDRNVAQRVAGWVVPRAKGGANHIRYRMPLPVFCHVACLDLLEGEPTTDQSTLF